jgi:putative protein kinase ArgK-like GTPase of G3E family
VKKQYKRNHQLWDAKDDDMPVFGTIASQFNDPGTNTLYVRHHGQDGGRPASTSQHLPRITTR